MFDKARDVLERRSESMIAVIDIGSNSLRLVIYDGLNLAPKVLLNEKVMCALGRGMNASGRLNPEGVALALDNTERFAALITQLGVRRVDVLATSAVRDAEDGADFVRLIGQRSGLKVQIITGQEEARLAAAGIRATVHDADGIVGDLGGGSVELALVGACQDGASSSERLVSLPLGPVRLLGNPGDESSVRRDIDHAIGSIDWLSEARGKTFYAIGGAWRALARVHMEQSCYPLHIIHGYRMSRSEAETFLSVVGRQSRRSLEKLGSVSRKRVETLPLASYVLYRLIRAIQPGEIAFSAYGLREGHLYSLLAPDKRVADPLVFAAVEMGNAHPRFGGGGAEVVRWMDPLFVDESDRLRRLRQAAAAMMDIAWDEHPDYRTARAFNHVLHMPAPAIDHPERVFLALALHARYGGSDEAPELVPYGGLLEPRLYARARLVGHALRLVHALTGGAPGLIARTGISIEGSALTLAVPEHTAIYTGDTVRRRLEVLARALDKTPRFCVGRKEDEPVRRLA